MASKLREAVADLNAMLGTPVSGQPVHTVRTWLGNKYQKRADGRWDKLGPAEKKKSKSRFKKS